MTDRMKIVAKRNAHKERNLFFKYLRYCGWTESEITEMWKYVERIKK